MADPPDPELFDELAALEKDFAMIEIDHMRQKEIDCRPLYSKRSEILARIPKFWPTVFANFLPDSAVVHHSSDRAILSALTSFSVERFGINENDRTGDPRNVRFTFTFAKNDFLEDEKLVKEFRCRKMEGDQGRLISQPLPIKWKGNKRDPTNGLLKAAVDLYEAEETMKLKKGDQGSIDMVERESLWQYEKLRTKLEKEFSMEPHAFSFFNWFGYRGPDYARHTGLEKGETKRPNQAASDPESDEEDESEEDLLLDVEIYPDGAAVTEHLAEEIWPNPLRYFFTMEHREKSELGDDEAEDSEAPDLIQRSPPAKRQRT